jgi:hypothetical protein
LADRGRTGPRRVAVYREGREVRAFPAVVGKAATPTPVGECFVEETLAARIGPGTPVRIE